jgi:hypothetical protein
MASIRVSLRRVAERTGGALTSLGSWLVARRPIEGGDSLAIECRRQRNRADELIAEYGRSGTTEERRQDIISELREIGRNWRTLGCQDEFGPIVLELGRLDIRQDAVGVPQEVQTVLTTPDQGGSPPAVTPRDPPDAT